MPIDPTTLTTLDHLLTEPLDPEPLAAFLLAHSNLPGPRANLPLVHAFAARAGRQPALLPALEGWIHRQSPPADPVEYLPLVATVALGACHAGADPDARQRIADELRIAANDPRWRVREGVSMGLQTIGEAEPDALLAILRAWLPGADPLEQRAIVTALAHPPLVKAPPFAAAALAICGAVTTTIPPLAPAARKSEGFKVLRQGLSFALSVVVAGAPAAGLPYLERLLTSGDPDLRAIVLANLEKARLAKPHAEAVVRLRTLAWAPYHPDDTQSADSAT